MTREQLPQLGHGGPVHGLRFPRVGDGEVHAPSSDVHTPDGGFDSSPTRPRGIEVAGAGVLARGMRIFQLSPGVFYAWCDLHRCPADAGDMATALSSDCLGCAAAEALVRELDDNDLAAQVEAQVGLARLMFALRTGTV
jgi:hypothetical protein